VKKIKLNHYYISFLAMDAENPTSPEFSRILLIIRFLAFSKIICNIKKIKNRSVILASAVRVTNVADWCTLLHHRPGAER
jgi:hypothetical protein